MCGIVTKPVSRWAMLAILCLYAVALVMAFQSIPPILSLIIEDIGISHAQAGLLMSLITLPGIFLLIPLSLISARFNLKHIGLLSLALTIFGAIVFMLARGLPLLMLGRLIMGIGTVALPIVGTQAVAQWFYGHRLGMAMGIYNAALMFATIIPLNSFGAIGLEWGWRATLLIVIAINLIAVILFVRFFRKPPEEPASTAEKSFTSVKALAKIGWPVWALACGWAFFQAGNLSLTTFLPDFIYTNGLNLQLAGSITSTMILCTLVLSTPVGYLLDRIRYKEILMIACSAASLIVIILLPLSQNLILLFVIILGISFSPMATATFALVPSLAPRSLMSVAFAIIATMSYIGMFLGPSLTGLIRDLTGSYQYSFWLIAFFFIAILVLIGILLRWRMKHQEERGTPQD